MRYIFKLGLQCLIAAAVMPHGHAAVVEYQIACPDLFDVRNVHFNNCATCPGCRNGLPADTGQPVS